MKRIKAKSCRMLIYEPVLQVENVLCGSKAVGVLELFRECTLITTNRFDECLGSIKKKIYTRDLFERD